MKISVEQKLEYAQRAISKSLDRIRRCLIGWDFEKYGEITKRKISDKIGMNFKSVYRHYPPFEKQINELNKLNEKER